MEAMLDLVVSRARDGVSYQIIIRRPGRTIGGGLLQILPKREAAGSWEAAIFYESYLQYRSYRAFNRAAASLNSPFTVPLNGSPSCAPLRLRRSWKLEAIALRNNRSLSRREENSVDFRKMALRIPFVSRGLPFGQTNTDKAAFQQRRRTSYVRK